MKQDNIIIECGCGCGGRLEKFDWRGRERRFIHGHHTKVMSNETKEKMSIASAGENNPFFGKHHTEESKQKNREKHLGELSSNWQGGITPLNYSIRCCGKYLEWRMFVFGRDNFICQECGAKGVWLEAHHIKKFSDIIKDNNIKSIDGALNCQELWNVSNGQTLCLKCHNKTRGY